MNQYPEFVIPSLPVGCEATVLGEPQGADAQYRCPGRLHIRKYGNKLIGHQDCVDPRTDLIGHLLIDAPLQTALSVGAGVATLAAVSGHGDAAVPAGLVAFLGVLAVATLARRSLRGAYC